MRVKIRILGEAFVGQFAGPGPEFYDNRTRPGPQEAQPLSATRGPRLQGHVYKVTLEPAAWPPFARRAAIRVGQAVVRCTVPGWLSDEYAAFTRRSVSALRRIPRLQRTRRRLTLPHGAVIPQG